MIVTLVMLLTVITLIDMIFIVSKALSRLFDEILPLTWTR